MVDESSSLFGPLPHPSENPDPETLFKASLAATSMQRIAWLEGALQLAYATGALKPRRMMTQEKWDAMGSLLQGWSGRIQRAVKPKKAPGAFLNLPLSKMPASGPRAHGWHI